MDSASGGSALLTRIDELSRASRSQADEQINEVFRDGVVTRAEAEALFELTPQFSNDSESWDARFCEAIADFLLTNENPANWVTDDEADWLIHQVKSRPNGPLAVDIDALLLVLRKAEGAPPRLGLFALGLACEAIQTEGRASAEAVERVRRAVYAPASDGGLWVTRAEANLLFKTNDAVAHAKNDPAWNDLFARMVGNHLMASAHPDPITESSALAREAWLKSDSGGILSNLGNAFGGGGFFERLTHDPKKASAARVAAKQAANAAGAEITDAETGWFLKRLGWDNSISPAERALVDFLKKEAPGFTHGLAAIN